MAAVIMCIPSEVDVFTVPHLRMKQLVNSYIKDISNTNFNDADAVHMLSHNLFDTFCEFKLHEQIENEYIVRKLHLRLLDLSISNSTVCNCHDDNRLSEMLHLVTNGYLNSDAWSGDQRNHYEEQLKMALDQFTDTFLPHMKEEEEVFQPLLMKYFDYDELKLLKTKVIEEHESRKRRQSSSCNEAEKYIADLDIQEKNTSPEDSSSTTHENDLEFGNAAIDLTTTLPDDVILMIFSYLDPRGLGQCDQVNRRWSGLSNHPTLWRNVNPVLWKDGIYDATEVKERRTLPSTMYNTTFDGYMRHVGSSSPLKYACDEDVDVDECNIDSNNSSYDQIMAAVGSARKYFDMITDQLLTRVGDGIHGLTLANSSITCSQLRRMLKLCRNLRYVDISGTSVTDTAFKELSLPFMERLNMTGCDNVTDVGLIRLVDAINRTNCCKLLPDCQHLSDDVDEVCLQSTSSDETDAGSSGFRYDLGKNDSAETDESFPVLRKDNCCRKLTCVDNEECTNWIIGRGLTYLNLSGCLHISDESFGYLCESGLVHGMAFLDVSGCYKITGRCLSYTVLHTMPNLKPENLYYCDHAMDGPYENEANGCQNLGSSTRYCCSNVYLN
ncbi:FBXL5 (predicted) [Pycnogonum litorale]